jgi:mono/diheme cytochrome c family protein
VNDAYPGPNRATCPTRFLVAASLAMLATQAAASGYPPATECPQPRFTGKAPEPIRSTPNPLPASRDVIAAGRTAYKGGVKPACSLCHGAEGDGRGMLSTQFDPRPRNFACRETVKDIPDGQLFWIIENGSPGTAMPGFGDKLTDRQIWQLVHYLRELSNR